MKWKIYCSIFLQWISSSPTNHTTNGTNLHYKWNELALQMEPTCSTNGTNLHYKWNQLALQMEPTCTTNGTNLHY